MTEITFKVNTRNLQLKLNELDLSKMTPDELAEFIKENISVSLIGNESDKRFYVDLKEDE